MVKIEGCEDLFRELAVEWRIQTLGVLGVGIEKSAGRKESLQRLSGRCCSTDTCRIRRWETKCKENTCSCRVLTPRLSLALRAAQ